MISIDTNVLLRHITQDDEVQSPKATLLINSHNKVLITDIVLLETVWTLSGKAYKASSDDVVTFISSLIAEPSIAFEDSQAIWIALRNF